MREVIVDHEKLAYGLEKGIGIASRTLTHLEPDERLRYSLCGLASLSIKAYSDNIGIDCELVAIEPSISVDPELIHVLPLVGPPEDSVVIDSAYSQFLWYVGLSRNFETVQGESYYHPDKILSFRLSNVAAAGQRLAELALQFHTTVKPRNSDAAEILDSAPLSRASIADISDVYRRIYNLTTARPWTPKYPEVTEEARIIATHIPSDTVTLK